MHAAVTPRILGSIRKSQRRDAPELARLFAAAHLDTPCTSDQDQLLVLDLDGSLRAAAQIVIGAALARLQLLILDPALTPDARREVEERMIGIVHALGEAHGCRELEVAPRHGATSST